MCHVYNSLLPRTLCTTTKRQYAAINPNQSSTNLLVFFVNSANINPREYVMFYCCNIVILA